MTLTDMSTFLYSWLLTTWTLRGIRKKGLSYWKFEWSRVKLYRKWPEGKWKLLLVRGRFELARVWLIGSRLCNIHSSYFVLCVPAASHIDVLSDCHLPFFFVVTQFSFLLHDEPKEHPWRRLVTTRLQTQFHFILLWTNSWKVKIPPKLTTESVFAPLFFSPLLNTSCLTVHKQK